MKPTRKSLAQRLLGGVDLLVDLATLGEYGLEPLPAEGPCRERSGHSSDWEAFARPSAGRAAKRGACAGDSLHERNLRA